MEPNYSIFPEKTVSYAGFWIRFGAAFLDWLILIPITYGLNYLITGHIVSTSIYDDSGGLSVSYFSVQGISSVIGWLYFALQESGAQQATFGKRAVGIKVTDLDGGRISFGRATGRYFAKIISAIILLIGYLMVAWDSKKQGLHDKLAGTLVINSGNE